MQRDGGDIEGLRKLKQLVSIHAARTFLGKETAWLPQFCCPPTLRYAGSLERHSTLPFFLRAFKQSRSSVAF
jgi:hypothetical protein